MRVSVIGCGYLGAVQAAVMAEFGHEVVGIDVDEARVEALTRGDAVSFEPGLSELLRTHVASGQLRFTTEIRSAAPCDVHVLTVGTPQRKSSHAADLNAIDTALTMLLPQTRERSLVVGKSTVPLGTADRLAGVIADGATGAVLAWSPEFLREGWAVKNALAPDRLVFGLPPDPEQAAHAEQGLRAVYAGVLDLGTPVVVTDFATAELVKLASNAFLATKISFINAMAEIAEATGANVSQLSDAMGYDDRIGRRFLEAGVGFGGGWLPMDLRSFTARAEELGLGASVAFLKEVDAINIRRRERVVDLVVDALDGEPHAKAVAVLGLAYKPQSDDVRDSPALDAAVRLRGLGARVRATDPAAIENARSRHPQIEYCATIEDTVRGADAVVMMTEWDEYRSLDPTRLVALVNAPQIIDARNIYDPSAWRDAGWEYRGLGSR